MTAPDRIPYPGLRAYRLDESDLFFGREGCVGDMVARLATTRFLAVLGASGIGKSSLVRTGLLDGLELGLLGRAGSRWRVADFHPGGQPMRNLAATLRASTGDGPGEEFEAALLESFLRRGPRSLATWCREGNLPQGTNLLLMVDQFEELFRYSDYAGREEAEGFVPLLLESARSPEAVYVVLTMRSEYLGACALIPGLAEAINAGLYLTRRLTRSECREAIEGPAGVLGFEIEPRLVTRLLNDLASFAPWEGEQDGSQLQRLSRRADQLPLMQHVLSRLWRAAKDRDEGRPVLTLADYEAIGELQGALDAHAKEVTDRLGEVERRLIRPLFRALVTGTSLSDAVRRPRTFADLAAVTGAEPDRLRAVIDVFRAADCNFLRPCEPVRLTDDMIVDISHESLFRQWSSLSAWLEEEARAAAAWQRLVNAQARHARGEGDLLRGLDLQNIVAWWDRERPSAGWARGHIGNYDEAVAFLEASRRRAEAEAREKEGAVQRERRRLRVRAGVWAVLCVVACVLGAATWVSNLRRNEAVKLEKSAAEKALAAQKVAEREQQVAQDANRMTLKVADQFLTNMAGRLHQAGGVPPQEIDRMLDEGARFMADLATKLRDSPDFARKQAHLLLAFAEVAGDRGDSSTTRGRIAAARAAIQRGRPEAELAGDDLALLGESYRLESQLFDEVGDYPRAEVAARRGHELVERSGSADAITRAKAAYTLGHALSSTGKVDGTIASAFDCLRLLDDAADHAAGVTVGCHRLLAWASAMKADSPGEAQHSALAQAALDRIPVGARGPEIIRAEVIIRRRLAKLKAKADDHGAVRREFKQVVDILQPFISANPWQVELRYIYALALRELGDEYKRYNNNESALYLYRQVIELHQSLVQTGKADEKVAENAIDALVALGIGDAAARALASADATGRIEISTDALGVAIRGYDPVAYFNDHKAAPGSTEHFAIWHGALWLFTSDAHRKAFVNDPLSFAPAFGGHCAFCAGIGHKVHGDPTVWNVHDGRLFFHRSSANQQSWATEPNDRIKHADNFWPIIKAEEIGADKESPFVSKIGVVSKIGRDEDINARAQRNEAAFQGGRYAAAAEGQAALVQALERAGGQNGKVDPQLGEMLGVLSW